MQTWSLVPPFAVSLWSCKITVSCMLQKVMLPQSPQSLTQAQK